MNERLKKERVFKFFGIEEPVLSKRLEDLFGNMDHIIWELQNVYQEIHLRLCIEGSDEPSLLKEFEKIEKEISRFSEHTLFAFDEQKMEDVVGKMLIEKKLTVSIAESCTGGRIGDMLTDVPGSSIYFLGGAIVYSNLSKEELLNVSPETLLNFGAVSEQTAKKMAEGVRVLFHSDIGISITGIAGPEGGSEAKPVGTVHIGLAAAGETFSGKYCLKGTRDQIKQCGSIMALDWARRYINGYPFIPGV